MFWKSRHLEFLLVKPYREQLTHLKNAHFININMKKRDLFEWYKDWCTKTCKNFLAWLFFFYFMGFCNFCLFPWIFILGNLLTWNWHLWPYRQVSYYPQITSHFFVKNCSIKRPFITSCPPNFHTFRRPWLCIISNFAQYLY